MYLIWTPILTADFSVYLAGLTNFDCGLFWTIHLIWIQRLWLPIYEFEMGLTADVTAVSRGCSLPRGTWSYLRICQRSVLPYTRFCNCLLDYDCVLHIVNFAMLYLFYFIFFFILLYFIIIIIIIIFACLFALFLLFDFLFVCLFVFDNTPLENLHGNKIFQYRISEGLPVPLNSRLLCDPSCNYMYIYLSNQRSFLPFTF
jgi:hypothetical protein